MHKKFIAIGALLAGTAVVLGAFAAHRLKAVVTVESLAVFETGVRYQMYHALAIIIVGILYKENNSKTLLLAGKFFIIGILIFSGSLYLLTALKTMEANNFLWVGAVTPLGGVAFITGWFLVCKSFWRK
jgi:uncharacterized membrane protein YgdD (TMEM256/DUF423 family)